jgi:hypothetical protein
MTALCVFVDVQSVSLLLYKTSDEVTLKVFPYVYSDALFSSSFTKAQFFESLLKSFCKENGVKLTDCDILATGFFEAPDIGMPIKFSKSLHEIFSSIHSYYPIYANNYTLMTPDYCYSYSPVGQKFEGADVKEVDEENFYANMEIYPQIKATDISAQMDIDHGICSLLRGKEKIPQGLPIVFLGSRFSQISIVPELDYILMLNLIRTSGVYDIRRDSSNVLVLYALLRMYKAEENFDLHLDREATLITTTGTLECMIKTEVGTSQLAEVEKDKVLVLPVGRDERLKLMVKARDIANKERMVNAGKIGLIFDTRLDKATHVADIKVFSAGLKAFKEALNI